MASHDGNAGLLLVLWAVGLAVGSILVLALWHYMIRKALLLWRDYVEIRTNDNRGEVTNASLSRNCVHVCRGQRTAAAAASLLSTRLASAIRRPLDMLDLVSQAARRRLCRLFHVDHDEHGMNILVLGEEGVVVFVGYQAGARDELYCRERA